MVDAAAQTHRFAVQQLFVWPDPAKSWLARYEAKSVTGSDLLPAGGSPKDILYQARKPQREEKHNYRSDFPKWNCRKLNLRSDR